MEIDEFKKMRPVRSIGRFKVKENEEKNRAKKKCARKGRMILLRKSKYLVWAWVSYKGSVKGMWQFDRPDTIRMQEINSKCVVCRIQ